LASRGKFAAAVKSYTELFQRFSRADVAEEEVSTVLDYALQDPTWSFESKKEAVTQLSEVLKNTRLLSSVVISLAQLFLSSNRPLQAVRILQDNIQTGNLTNDLRVREYRERVCQNVLSRWHFSMLNDKVRNEAYRDALIRRVKRHTTRAGHKTLERTTMLDIGTGSGLLALYAKDVAENAQVYACESDPDIAALARAVLEKNCAGQGTVNLQPCDSKQLNLNQNQVDLIVMEVFDAGLLGENVIPTVRDAHERLGVSSFIPCRAVVHAAPVKCPHLAASFTNKPSSCPTLNLHQVRLVNRDTDKEPYTCEDMARTHFEFLSDPVVVATVDFESKSQVKEIHESGEKAEVEFQAKVGGNLDGFLLWFELILDSEEPEIRLSTAPRGYENCCWDQAFYPTLKHESAFNQDTIKATFSLTKDHIALLTHEIVERGEQKDKREANKPELKMPKHVISELNDEKITQIYSSIAADIVRENESGIDVLDYSSTAAIALGILKLSRTSELTLLIKADEEQSCEMPEVGPRVNMVSELAEINGINQTRIDGVGLMSLQPDDKFDAVFIDPVESTGRLNESSIKKLPILNRALTPRGAIYPQTLSLHCQLVDCQQIHRLFHVVDHQVPYGIAEVVNQFSTTHQQDIRMNSFQPNFLSDPVHVKDINLGSVTGNEPSFSKVLPIHVKRKGEANCLVYWFELKYGQFVVSTYEKEDSRQTSHFKQSVITFKNPNEVNEGDELSLTFLLHKGLIDFYL